MKQFLTENIHSEGSGLESRQSQLYIGKSEVCAHVCVWVYAYIFVNKSTKEKYQVTGGTRHKNASTNNNAQTIAVILTLHRKCGE